MLASAAGDLAASNSAALDRCTRNIPGWFKGQGVYNAAVAELGRHSHDAPLFLEIGAYLGQSACYMTHLLDSLTLNVTFHIIDFWGSTPRQTIDGRDIKAYWPNRTLVDGMARHEASIASWAPAIDTRAVMQFGKGDFQLAWAHFVKTFGKWDNIASIIRGSSKDVNIVGRYIDNSVNFLYLDTTHDNTTITELELWWPKVKPGGRMCGDDYDKAPVSTSLDRYFSSASLPVTNLPHKQWCVRKPTSNNKQAARHRGHQ